ncbi:MAG: phospholipid carrier-dependent glycosyltransferase, partial [Candidatus Binataceae bacterium]
MSLKTSRWQRLLLSAVAAAILYLPALGRPALLEPDEGRYAEIAREMVIRADYVTPHNDWVRYFEKPPLVYWMMAGSIRILGKNEFAVRLPTALFSIGEVVVTEALGEAIFGPAAGLLGAIALALSPIVIGFARFATLDPALAFFITAAMAAFYMAARSGDFARGGGRNWFILSAAMLGLGTLTKGPVALVLGGAIALIFILLQRRRREILRIPWLSSIIVYCAIVVPWFVIVARRHPGLLQFFFLHEHVNRYLKSTEHGWGPYFFGVVAIVGAWPWFYFAAAAVVDIWRNKSADNSLKRALKFLIIWFFVILIFFSIPRSKLGSYILPGIPPLAILAGYGLERFTLGVYRRGFIAWFAIINVAAGACAMAAILLAARRISGPLAIDGAIVAGALIVTAAATWAASYRDRRRIAVAVIALGMLIAAGSAAKAREDGAALFSYRRLADTIKPYLIPNSVFASYHHFVQSLPFYTGHREALVGYRGELAPFSRSTDARAS